MSSYIANTQTTAWNDGARRVLWVVIALLLVLFARPLAAQDAGPPAVDPAVAAEAERSADEAESPKARSLSETLREEVENADYPAPLRRRLLQRAAQVDLGAAIERSSAAARQAHLENERRAQTSPATQDSEDAEKISRQNAELAELERQKIEAEKAEEKALDALIHAREMEARERDETLRELLARQRKAAEEMLALTRSHSEKMVEIRQDAKAQAEAFAAKRGAFLAKIDTFSADPAPQTRRQEVDPLFAELIRERKKARRDFAQVLAQRDSAQRALSQARARQLQAKSRLAEVESTNDEDVVTEIHKRRQQAARAEFAVADKALEASQEILQEREKQYDEIERRLLFFRTAIPRVLPRVSAEARRKFFEFSDANLAYALSGVQEGVQHILHHLDAELLQKARLDLSSLDVWRWLWGLLWRILLILVLMRLVLPNLSAIMERWNKTLLERRFFRDRASTTLKFTDAVEASARPLCFYLAAQFLVHYLISAELVAAFSAMALLEWTIDAIFIYWILIRVAQVFVLPRWYRHQTPTSSFQLGLLLMESGPPADPANDPQLKRAKKLVRSVRVILFFALLSTYVPDAVRLIIGVSIFSWVIDFLAVWGLFAIVYWVLSTWKDDIAAVFARLAGDRMPRAVEVVNTRKDKFYGVFIIAAASIYVLGRETVRVGRKYLLNTEWYRQINTLLFRAKIELRNRDEETEPTVTQLMALPDQYAAAFAETGAPAASGHPEDILFERPDELDALLGAYTSWTQDRLQGAVVIVGEPGSGKTTLLDQFVAKVQRGAYPDHGATLRGDNSQAETPAAAPALPVIRREIIRRVSSSRAVLDFLVELFALEAHGEATEKAIITQIRTLEPRVVVLDDCHGLFLRKIGGFSGLETLFNVISATDQTHFYALSFNFFAWSYVNRVRVQRHFFGKMIRLNPWSDTELQALIEARTRPTDYQIGFGDLLRSRDPDAAVENPAALAKTARGYFRYLQEFSGGNPRLAMTYWLRSLRADPADNTLHVSLFRRPSTGVFSTFSDDHWFVLTAIAQHGSLSAAEIAKAVHLDIGFCKLALRYFKEANIVTVDPKTRQATLTPLYYRQVLKYLAHSNFLYG